MGSGPHTDGPNNLAKALHKMMLSALMLVSREKL